MSEISATPHETPTATVAESCEAFGAELHAAFNRKPHWIAAAIAPCSFENFYRFCTEPDRAQRFPLGLALTALRVLIRREGIAAAQRILDVALRPLGLVTVPVEERAARSRNVEHELLEAQVAVARVSVMVADAKADGFFDDREKRNVGEAIREAKNELDDIAEVIK